MNEPESWCYQNSARVSKISQRLEQNSGDLESKISDLFKFRQTCSINPPKFFFPCARLKKVFEYSPCNIITVQWTLICGRASARALADIFNRNYPTNFVPDCKTVAAAFIRAIKFGIHRKIWLSEPSHAYDWTEKHRTLNRIANGRYIHCLSRLQRRAAYGKPRLNSRSCSPKRGCWRGVLIISSLSIASRLERLHAITRICARFASANAAGKQTSARHLRDSFARGGWSLQMDRENPRGCLVSFQICFR